MTLILLLLPLSMQVGGVTMRTPSMVTCYPGGGAKYVKHVDNPDNNGRRITLILYLNPSWREGDGGELRLYGGEGEQGYTDVPPLMNRAVIFYSDTIPHEVLSATVDRYAVTLWYYDGTPEAARAAISRHLGGDMGSGAVSEGERDAELSFLKACHGAARVMFGEGNVSGIPFPLSGLGPERGFLSDIDYESLYGAALMHACSSDGGDDDGGGGFPLWLKGSEAGWGAIGALRMRIEVAMESLSACIVADKGAPAAASQRHRSRTKVTEIPPPLPGSRFPLPPMAMIGWCDNPDDNGRGLSVIYCMGRGVTLLLQRGGHREEVNIGGRGEAGLLCGWTRVDLKPNQAALLWSDCRIRLSLAPLPLPIGGSDTGGHGGAYIVSTFYSDREEALSAYRRCSIQPIDADSPAKKIAWLNVYISSGRELCATSPLGGRSEGIDTRESPRSPTSTPVSDLYLLECRGGVIGYDAEIIPPGCLRGEGSSLQIIILFHLLDSSAGLSIDIEGTEGTAGTEGTEGTDGIAGGATIIVVEEVLGIRFVVRIPLQWEVDQEALVAKFDRASRVLTVAAPLV